MTALSAFSTKRRLRSLPVWPSVSCPELLRTMDVNLYPPSLHVFSLWQHLHWFGPFIRPSIQSLCKTFLFTCQISWICSLTNTAMIISHSVSLYLLAVDALQSKLLLIAGQTVVVGILLDKAPGANGLLATVAGEATLMPTVALMLHLFRAWWVHKMEKEREWLTNVIY